MLVLKLIYVSKRGHWARIEYKDVILPVYEILLCK